MGEAIENFHKVALKAHRDIKINATVSVAGQEVLYKMKLPPHNHKEEEDLKAAFKAHKPEYTAKFAMGNDFETMVQDRSKNIIAVVNGLKMSAHFTVASSIFQMLKDSGVVPPPAVDVVEGLVSLTTDNTIRYRASLKEKKTIPSLQDLKWEEVAGRLQRNDR